MPRFWNCSDNYNCFSNTNSNYGVTDTDRNAFIFTNSNCFKKRVTNTNCNNCVTFSICKSLSIANTNADRNNSFSICECNTNANTVGNTVGNNYICVPKCNSIIDSYSNFET